MTRIYWRALARSMPIALLVAATAAAQVPVARPDRVGATAATQTGAAPGAKAGAPKPGAAAISPLSPVLAPPARQRAVTGSVGSHALERINTAAATAAALVPSAPRWVPVTVVGRNGGRVPRLRPDDLGIVEDGVRQRATSVERWPLWLVVVLDVGRQVGPVKQLAVHRQLVYDLLYALGEDDHVALVQYSDGIDLIQPWTQDRGEAEEALSAKFESGLDGQLWDSVTFAVQNLLEGKLGHKIVVCVTDGVDQTSHEASFTRSMALLRETATTLHVVNLGRYLEEHIRDEAYGVNGVLNVIKSPSYVGRRKELRQYGDMLGTAPPKMVAATTESGGMLWMADPEKDPALLPKQVWQQIEGQYMVAYVPERDGDPRSASPTRALSAFVKRGDIEARTPGKLYVPIVPPRSAPAKVLLRRR